MRARNGFTITGVAAAMLAAFGGAHAQNVQPLAPSGLNVDASSVSLGAGFASDDDPRFGQYNGITREGAYGLIDFNMVRRDDETGTWTGFFGRNVALENRQLRFDLLRQGDWGFSVDYAQIPRFEPYSITTAVSGIGTPNLTVPGTPTAGGPAELSTRRERLSLGVEKFLSGNWDLQVTFRNEEKIGARIFGRGTPGTVAGSPFGAFEFTPEPINSDTRQFEAKINYTGAQLQLTGGYYGTMYNNQYSGLNIAGGSAPLAASNPPFTPIGLPPDNQSHQLYLSGGYGFTPTTRGNFKVAYAKATQDAPFISTAAVPPLPAPPANSLDGRVDTTLVQAGVTSRPMPKLTVFGDLRYENRDDKTPIRLYGTPGPTTDGNNEPRSIKTTTGKVEASYALPDAFRLTGGIGYEEKERNTSPIRVVSFREKTDEISYRVELRRMMSESLTGALSYVHSDRGGSPFQLTTVSGGGTGSNLIAPLHLADRKRDKVRFTANWMPAEPLTLNFFVEAARDDYSPREGSSLGPHTGSAMNFSIDAAYAVTDQWQVTGWYTKYDTKAEQSTCVGASSAGVCPAAPTQPVWSATIKNLSNNFGLGLRGKPVEVVQIGADLTYSNIKDQFQQEALVGNPIASLPDITTKLTRLNVFGKYALDKDSGVRLDYIYDRYSTDNWTWSTWVYADGTVVGENPTQKVSFVAVSYFFKF